LSTVRHERLGADDPRSRQAFGVTGRRPSVRLREYTDEQIEAFERADVLDGEVLENARRFDRATGGIFFQDRPSENRSDRP
jgi:hypothetical protein